MPEQMLLIGLDAMEWDLVQRWANEAKMPTFQRLIRNGFSTELSTTAAQLPDTVWSSVYSGTNPAKFEKYFYIQYDRKTGDLRNVSDDEINATPFWDYVSTAGRRVAIVDVPKFPLSRELNGVQVANWGAHAAKTARASNPPSLLSDIDRGVGRHPVGDCDAVDANPASLADLKQRILSGVKVHGELFRWLLRQQRWDMFFASFSEPHCIGHHYWHYMDASHPRHPKTDPAHLSSAIESVYRAIDREIGEMIQCAGPNVTTLVFAGHGMGASYHASWNLQEILDTTVLGRRAASKKKTVDSVPEAQVNPWRVLKMVMPGKLQYAIKSLLPKRLQNELLFRWYAGSRDWAGRRAFAIPNNDSVGAIRINLRGRDRYGIVSPGEEYRTLCQAIAEALNELVDLETGRKLVRRVTILADEFSGPFLDNLPDITVLWEQSLPWSSIHSNRLGTLKIRAQDSRSGGHTAKGFLVAAGSHIPTVRYGSARSIYDIAPTVLTAMNVPVPEHMDGTPLWTATSLANV